MCVANQAGSVLRAFINPVRYMLICKSGYSFSDVFCVSVDVFVS